MASNNTSNKGAAEEPEPSRPPSSPPRPPSYDPSKYQRPHPDERGGGGGSSSKSTKGKTKTKTGAKSKASTKASPTTKDKPPPDEGKGKDAPPPDLCGWCEKLGAKLRCSQCKVEVYCDRDCQGVSVRGGRRGRGSGGGGFVGEGGG